MVEGDRRRDEHEQAVRGDERHPARLRLERRRAPEARAERPARPAGGGHDQHEPDEAEQDRPLDEDDRGGVAEQLDGDGAGQEERDRRQRERPRDAVDYQDAP